ncbi:hypothetical protein GDO86_013488 [Hymenochirus boettgeri]|uniref:Major facilitator superfamily (MFS) profile domain-containing protein n=2 Tax=Hymenochirus boettgeri TaxID=247094 RepID=A0A8T2IVJ0_9PIPI|nr:hypothetical protein GDO86_013488 [Hymenochirus boettgeri]KAG8435567.1 hypothetical protein GDO86_013488 [Hymenochirus boettgeri]
MVNPKPPDGGWGWVIVIASFFIQLLSFGSPLTVGVLYVEWLEVFDEGKGKTAWIGSLANGIGLLGSPLGSAVVSSFGVRPVIIFSGVLLAGGLILSSFAPNLYVLYLTYGLMVGFGCGLSYPATVTITSQYFDQKRGLALGIFSTGSSIGAFIYAALQKELIRNYGLEGCLLITGALSLNILACGILMRPLPQPYAVKPTMKTQNTYKEKESDTEEHQEILEKIPEVETDGPCCLSSDQNGHTVQQMESTEHNISRRPYTNLRRRFNKEKCNHYLDYWDNTKDLFKNRAFTALFLAIFLFDIGGFPVVLLLEDIAKNANIPENSMPVPLISIVGISTAVGKLILGILADFKWINSLYLYVFTLLATGLTIFAMPYVNTYTALALVAGIIGFSSGNWSIFPYVTTKTVGLDKLTHAYGILMFIAGVGYCLGPPLFGWCIDMTQTYELTFYLSGTCVIIGGILLLVIGLPVWDKNACKKPNRSVGQEVSNT